MASHNPQEVFMYDNLDNSNRRMSRRRLGVLLASAVGALVIVAVAAAANSASFPDQPGDVTLAPDINRLDVSNDDAGTITINVVFPQGRTIGLPGDEVGVALDLDQNPDTGSVYYGTEALVMFEGSTLRFGRAAGNGFSPAAPPPSLHGAIGTGVVTFSVSASDLGLTPRDGFNIVALSDNSVVGELDAAPDIRTFNYQQVFGTTPPTLGPDPRAPVDRAFASRGVHGKTVRLSYWAADGRGVTADTLRVYRKSRLLGTVRIRLGDASPFLNYYARWHAPRKVRGKLRFCVQSTDAAGNRSNQSCAPLTIR
jgi:hypothetical protein